MKRAATVCLTGLALIAAGCGGGDGDDKAEYEKQVRETGSALEKTFGALGSDIGQAGSPEAAAAKLDDGAQALDKAADDLEGIDPPSEVEEAHNQVVQGLHELADEFRDGAEAAKGGDVDALVQFASQIQMSKAVQKIQKASETFQKEGYDFGGS